MDGMACNEWHLNLYIQRLGEAQPDGTHTVTFGTLFADDKIQNTYEALGGSLKAAKRKGIVSYGPELLMQGMSDNVVITLNKV